MRTTITKQFKNEVEFAMIREGEVFIYNNEAYLRIQSFDTINCVNLDAHCETEYLRFDQKVIPVDCEIIIGWL